MAERTQKANSLMGALKNFGEPDSEVEAEQAAETPLFLAAEDAIRQAPLPVVRTAGKRADVPSDSIAVLQGSNMAGLQYDRIAGLQYGSMPGMIVSNEERNMDVLNAANAVVLAAEQPAVKKDYRPITVRIELHHDNWMNARTKERGLKKQDIVNAALTLYRQFAEEKKQ